MADLNAMKGMAAESVQHAVAQQQMQAVSWRVHMFLERLLVHFCSKDIVKLLFLFQDLGRLHDLYSANVLKT